jgi:lysophospholipase L1-like esterase
VLPVLPVVLYALYPPANRGSQQAVVAYEKVAAEVTAGTGAVLADVASRWDPTTMLAADGAHPNQLGETTIAESVLRGVAACRPA